MSNVLYPDQDLPVGPDQNLPVGPDQNPNCLPRLSVDKNAASNEMFNCSDAAGKSVELVIKGDNKILCIKADPYQTLLREYWEICLHIYQHFLQKFS